MSPKPVKDLGYEQGYTDGGNSAHADWAFALGEYTELPDDFDFNPTRVAQWIADEKERTRTAVRVALTETADAWQQGAWADVLTRPKVGPMTVAQSITDWLRDRVDQT